MVAAIGVEHQRAHPDGAMRASAVPAGDAHAHLPSLVLVEWHDAWFDFDLPAADQRRTDYLVRTVGFLVAEDPRFLSLAQEVLPEGEGFRAVTHIPVAIVERVQRLSPHT
jgi:hypothetical protein